MEIDMDKRHWEHGPCPKHDCRKDSCKCGLRLISFPAALGDDSKGSPVAPKNGDYCNALVKYESNGHIYVYSTEGVPERLSSNGTLNFEELLNRPRYNGEVMTGETDIPEVPSAVSQLTNDLDFQTGEEVDSTVASAVATETTARQQADNTLQSAISGVSNALGSEATTRRNADTTLQNNIATVSNNLSSETTARQGADNNLQSQIDGISASSDVKDIVGTYAELQAYDTSTLGNNDIIKVLQDEAHSDETTYYRWSTTTQTFTLIGEEGPYYTKAATNALLAEKQDELTAGDNITIENNVISAEKGSIFTVVYAQSQPDYGEDTTSIYKDINWSQKYTLGELIDLWKTGETIYAALTSYSPDYESDTPNAILVEVTTPGPYSGDYHVFTFYEAGMLYCYSADDLDTTDFYLVKQPTKNPTMLQKVFTGINSLAVVSQAGIQNAFTIDNNVGISNSDSKLNSGRATNSVLIGTGTIGYGTGANANNSIAIGNNTKLWKSNNSIQMLGNTSASSGGTADGCVAIGYNAVTNTPAATTGYGKIALGAYSAASATGEMNIGSSSATYGYNNSNYRLLTGLYDPQNAHDAATKGYVDNSLSGKQNTLTAGSNISISGDTISATDTTYTAGNGLDLTGTAFSVDTTVVATQTDLAGVQEQVTSYITDATEYSASATYAVGDYVIHDGAIYQCNIAIVGGEAWNSSHWDIVPSLQDQLDNTETWTFKLEGGTTVTKKVVVR